MLPVAIISVITTLPCQDHNFSDGPAFMLAGDFDPCEMKALLEEKLGSWQRQPSEPDQVPTVPNTPIPEFAPGADTVYLVDRPGLTQASIWASLECDKCNVVTWPLFAEESVFESSAPHKWPRL